MYNSLDITCEFDEDCPNHTHCDRMTNDNRKCTSNFNCGDKSRCYFHNEISKKELGIYDKYLSVISKYRDEFGKMQDVSCTSDSECFRAGCNVGKCGSRDSDSVTYGMSAMFGMFLLFICVVVACVICFCTIHKKGKKDSKE